MKIAVIGLWHLGAVTAACLAKAGYDVIAYDPDANTIANLKNAKPQIFEPGLENLLLEAKDRICFTADRDNVFAVDVMWVTFDTPVDNNDVADVEFVVDELKIILTGIQQETLMIISSQLPVGTSASLKKFVDETLQKPFIDFACIPENLRLGKAIDVFTHPDRIVVGLDNPEHKTTLEKLLKPFSDNLIWMSVVSAEMTKHAINAFLAISVTFINELAALCETVGADGRDVERGLKSEDRIGAKAYLRPGGAIGGGTLMRDIYYLTQLGKRSARDTFLISAIIDSNHYHKQWSCRKLLDLLRDLKGKKIAMLGLTYKADTDTLRRSTAIETCEWLHSQGTQVSAYDPSITHLPKELAHFINFQTNVLDAVASADAVVISTEWPQFRDINVEDLISKLNRPLVIDPSGFVAKNIGSDLRIEYFSVGVP